MFLCCCFLIMQTALVTASSTVHTRLLYWSGLNFTMKPHVDCKRGNVSLVKQLIVEV